jgi:hypothetical protein
MSTLSCAAREPIVLRLAGVDDQRDRGDHREPRIDALGEGAAHRRRQHRLGLDRRLGDELEEQGQVAHRHLAARLIGHRHHPVIAVLDRLAALDLIERVDLRPVGDAAVHLRPELQPVVVVIEREQRPLARQRLEGHREGVLRRLADADRRAVADQPLLDDLAAEEHADAQDAPAGAGRLRVVFRVGRHQNGAFFTEARISGRKSCFRFSHS